MSLTVAERVALWDAINAYTESCDGAPSEFVYGNVRRQRAVALVERVIEEALRARERLP